MFIDKVMRRFVSWRRSFYRWVWLRHHGRAHSSRGVFIVGAQRSGTTMLMDCFYNSPEFEVYGEMSVAFEDSVLKSLDTARNLIEQSRRPMVVFKPLTDSHRVSALLSVNETAKAIWMYRMPEDRARSAVAKFGDTNLRFLRELIESGPTNRWEARGISAATLATLCRLQPALLDAHSAAAAFWFLRNQLFFDQNLENNPSVLLLKYEMLVTESESTMRVICDFIGCQFNPIMIRNVHAGSVGRHAARISPEVSELCSGMLEKLDACLVRQWGSLGVESALASQDYVQHVAAVSQYRF